MHTHTLRTFAFPPPHFGVHVVHVVHGRSREEVCFRARFGVICHGVDSHRRTELPRCELLSIENNPLIQILRLNCACALEWMYPSMRFTLLRFLMLPSTVCSHCDAYPGVHMCSFEENCTDRYVFMFRSRARTDSPLCSVERINKTNTRKTSTQYKYGWSMPANCREYLHGADTICPP